MSTKDGGPAFPFEYDAPHHMGYEGQTEKATHGGMTMRQYYKAAALASILQNGWRHPADRISGWHTAVAKTAAAIADAMIAEDEEASK